MQYYKIFQGVAIPYSALVSVIFGLMLLSFPVGAYLFFNSQIGKTIDYHYPLSELQLVQKFNLDFIGQIEIGSVFVVAWLFSLIIFAIAVFGPKKNFLKVLTPMMAGMYERQNGNYIIHSIKWFAIIIILSEGIENLQELVGIKTVVPAFENDLLQFLSITIAPPIEELGFRIILIGIPVFFIYSQRASVMDFFRALWSPYQNLQISSSTKAIAIIVVVGIFFGFSHIMSEQWSTGKFAQAAMGGIIIGWVYFRYGFVAGVLIHWATNYMIYSYGFLVSVVNGTSIVDAFAHPLLQTIEVLLVVTGALGIVLLAFDYGRKKLEVQ